MAELSAADVQYLVDAHGGFDCVPSQLHRSLCHKLVNGILDGGASFYLAEREGGLTTLAVHALEAITASEGIWLCEHILSFKTDTELKATLVCDGQRLKGLTSAEESTPINEIANELLSSHTHELLTKTGEYSGAHYILDELGDSFYDSHDSADDNEINVKMCAFFSPLHQRHFSAIWACRNIPADSICVVEDDTGAYLENSMGGKCNLRQVQSKRFIQTFFLDAQCNEQDAVIVGAGAGAGAEELAKQTQRQQHPPPPPPPAPAPVPMPQQQLLPMTNLNSSPSSTRTSSTGSSSTSSAHGAHPLYLVEDFLTPEEVRYIVDLVYGSGTRGFGTQFVQNNQAEDAQTATATRNRLRTSHFVREVWWRAGEGRVLYESMCARAAALVGMPAAAAESPQIVCYPGGATYFRRHHDSGRLLEGEGEGEEDGREEDGEEHRGPSVLLHRDHFGAARVVTVFVYLTGHAVAEGGATRFSHLGDAEDGGLRVRPKAGAAAVWCNVKRDGSCEVDMVHEAEELCLPYMITMEDALKDRKLPMKIGLNLWFTDRAEYPHPEFSESGKRMAYSAEDVQSGV